jgi:broad specificity phosphatase PhoE
MVMAVKRLVFIRPGETAWNRSGQWQGWVAAPLSEHGRAQAEALARFVRHIQMAALYTSDLRRAVETAEILASHLDQPPIVDSRLRERNIGIWQGLTFDEVRSWYPEEYAALLASVDTYRIPNGESRADVRERMLAAYRDIIQADPGETVGILTHTTASKVLLASLVPGYDPINDEIGNTSVTTIMRDDPSQDVWRLVAVNDRSHLEGLDSRYFPEMERLA